MKTLLTILGSAALIAGCAGTPELTELQQSNLDAASNVRILAGQDGIMNLVDLNNDGVADGKLIDTNNDGNYDGVDTNNDGKIDEPLVDTDGDEIPDSLDSNKDDIPDVTVEYPHIEDKPDHKSGNCHAKPMESILRLTSSSLDMTTPTRRS